MKTALALRYVAFDDLGCLEPVLEAGGYDIQYAEIGVTPLEMYDPLEADLVIVLGGPIAVYEVNYASLTKEIAWIRTRLLNDQPTLGICLGAQLMAAALGARVYSGVDKEIGWAAVHGTADARAVPGLVNFLKDIDMVMHRHRDTFDIPTWARRLASSARCSNQAFSWGNYCLAIQFHPEFDPLTLERWLAGRTLELSATESMTAPTGRVDPFEYESRSSDATRRFFACWVKSLEDKIERTKASKPPSSRCLRNF